MAETDDTQTPKKMPMPLGDIADACDSRAVQADWRHFFDTYADFIFGVARNEGLSETDADEVVQIVMSELARGGAAARYDKSLGPLEGWLARLAVWRARNYHRREDRRTQAHREAVEQAAVSPTAATDLERIITEEWERVVTDTALERLRAETNPVHFQAYYASVFEELSAPDVQSRCGISAENLYQIRRRVGKRFRAILEETMHEFDAPPPHEAKATCKTPRHE
jgi:RNA polymerase sigma factor (sigma-70 family)